MKVEKTYRIQGKDTPISEVRKTLRFYLANALRDNSRVVPKDDISEEDNKLFQLYGKSLLESTVNLLDSIEPRSVEIVEDPVPLSGKHRKQTGSARWILDPSERSRIVVETKQNSHYDRSFDASFRLRYQERNILGYKTKMELGTNLERSLSEGLITSGPTEEGISFGLLRLLGCT